MGRKKEYIEEEVLKKAMHCFWINGYSNTSIRKLEQEMGINQFSIYSSFGSKSNLYAKVLQDYVSTMKDTYMKKLLKDDADIDDVKKFLINFGSAMANHEIPGSCLMVRSMINYEIFSSKIKRLIDDFSIWMKSLYTQVLERSIENGLIPNTISIENEAQYLMGITQSLSIMNKNKKSHDIEQFVINSIEKLK